MPWAFRHSEDTSQNPNFLLKVSIQGHCKPLMVDSEIRAALIGYWITESAGVSIKPVFIPPPGDPNE